MFFLRFLHFTVVFCRFLCYAILDISAVEEFYMKVSYKKLWILLAHKEMSKAELRKSAGIAPATFTKLRRNQDVALSVLLKIAEVLDCDVCDMMSFVKDSEVVVEADEQ